VKAWRAEGYPGVTRTTLELLEWWRREGRRQSLFFAQVEAAETIVFLTEARSDYLQGIEVPGEPGGSSRRYATKVATSASADPQV
jgi:type III restriction enzyme